jgi:hypothetical protein
VSLVALAFFLAGSSTASASVMWCRSDPLVVIDGYLVDVFVSVPIDQVLKVSGATEIIVTTPPGVDIALASPGVGFGYGENMTFAESPALHVTDQGMQIRAKVLVPAAEDSVPVQVQLAPRIVGLLAPTTVEGVSNTWVSQRTTI